MYMKDYIDQLDAILSATGGELLTNAGKVSHSQAIDKATQEYRKYQVQELSPVEEEYLKAIKNTENTAKALLKKNSEEKES